MNADDIYAAIIELRAGDRHDLADAVQNLLEAHQRLVTGDLVLVPAETAGGRAAARSRPLAERLMERLADSPPPAPKPMTPIGPRSLLGSLVLIRRAPDSTLADQYENHLGRIVSILANGQVHVQLDANSMIIRVEPQDLQFSSFS